MSRFYREEVYQKIGKIVSQFTNLQCDKCAQAVMQWLELNGIEGKIIQLRTKRRNDFFIVSNRYSPFYKLLDEFKQGDKSLYKKGVEEISETIGSR